MKMEKLYRMESSHGYSFLGVWNKMVRLDSVKCPQNPNHQRAGKRLTPLSVDFSGPNFGEDFLWTSFSECLVKEDAATALAESKITGFSTRKAEVTYQGRKTPLGYFEFCVTGWGGIAPPASGVKLQDRCSACGYLEYTAVTDWGNLIDWEQWDGSDIFMVWPLPRFIFVTSRAAKMFEDLQPSGVIFRPVDELDPQEGGLSPGRVSYWLPANIIESHRISADVL